ncbi:MAG: methyl-accepting chemotaxis protein [Deltaproteobacteria bacterium]|nr:methyl-accepting chemotaxis protein [Deltaproteobacteria bacterium]
MKLGTKLLMLFLIIGLTPFAIIGLVARFQASDALGQTAFNQLTAIREIKKSQVTDYFESIRKQVITNATSDHTIGSLMEFSAAFSKLGDGNKVRAMSEAQRMYVKENPNPAGEKHKLMRAPDGNEYNKVHGEEHPWFKDFLEKFGYYDIFLVDKDGWIVYSVYKEQDYGTSLKSGQYASEGIAVVFNDAMNKASSQEIAFSDFRPYAASNGAPASFIAAPIMNVDEKIGALIFQMPIGEINRIMQQRDGMGKTGESYLIGPNKLMRSDSFLDPEKHSVTASFANPKTGSVDTEGAREALKGSTDTRIIIDYNGNPVLSAYTPLDIFGIKWALLTEIDESEAFASVNQLDWIMLGTGVVGALILMALVPLLTRSVTNSVTGPIRKVIDGLIVASDQIASASSQVASSSQALSSGASEQAASLEETSSTLEEISSMTRQNSDNTNLANDQTQSANNLVEKGSGAMGRMVQAIRDVKESSDATAKIIKTIDEIAFQTNLLALNAAVEAARAGDAGRGFAVVAEEVRNLALRSAEAAKDTNNMLETSQQRADLSVTTAEEVEKLLTEIQRTIQDMSTLMNQVSQGSVEQSRGIEQVTAAMAQMDTVTQSNAASAEETASSSEELSAQSQELLGMVNQLIAVVGKGGETSQAQISNEGFKKVRLDAPAPQRLGTVQKARPIAKNGNGTSARTPKLSSLRKEMEEEEVLEGRPPAYQELDDSDFKNI